MTATQDDTIAELQRTVAELRQERDGALSEKATLAVELAVRTAELATRNSEFGERIEHQSATIDVLRAMSASPGDAQPVFELIVERARDLCDAYGATVYEFDGTLIHYRAATGVSDDATVREQVAAVYPIPATHYSGPGRAILDRRIIRIDDLESEPGLHPILRRQSAKSAVFLPLLRGNLAMGALSLGSRERGGFSDSQIELLKTFAEQAVIAITSAETYRALQTRTNDLQETLEYQTATSDVLKVISGSEFELEPVFQAVVETATRLCRADQAVIYRYHDGVYRWAAGTSLLPDYERIERGVSIPPGTGTVVGRVALEHRPIEILDALADPLYEVKDDARVGGIRTLLGVPLMRDGTSIGVIGLARQRVEAFTERQIELVKVFADQAVIAIENTRLITEQREALEQQTATAEVLAVINASPGDLAPVFDAILEKAMRLCDAAFGMFNTYDGTSFHTVVTRGVPAAFAAFRAKHPPIPGPDAPIGRALETRRPVHVLDWQEEAVYKRGTPGGRAITDLGGARTVLNVPLVKDAAVLGMISFYRQQVRPFSDKQIALLESFAAQAVIAMENARLITEQREALEQQTATAEVLQVINASPGDLAPVFDAILEKAMHLCGAVFGSLTAWDGQYANVLAMRGFPPALSQYMAARDPRAAIAPVIVQLAKTKRPQQIADVKAGEGYRGGHPIARAVADLGGARTILHVPLRKDEAMLGYISVYRQEVRAFTDKQITLLENFAAQAVIAMENAGLLTEQQEALEQQTATAEVLQVINASPGNLAPVFDAMLDKALRLCDANFGQLTTFDGVGFRAAAWQGFPPEPSRPVATTAPTPGMALYRLVHGEDVVHVPDITTDELYRSGNSGRRRLADEFGARTAIWVALRKDTALLGAFVIYRTEVRPFSNKQIALLQNFGAQAVIAMENARLITEQREALEQQTATAEVLQVINASPGDLTPVFEAILEKAHSLCGSAAGSLVTYDGECFRAMKSLGLPERYAALLRQPFRPNRIDEPLLRGERLVYIPDYSAVEAMPGEEVSRSMVEWTDMRSVLLMPMRKDDALLGYIAAVRHEVRAFSEKEIALLENFAAQAVIAMENARLLNEVRQRQEELRITFENMGDGVAMFDETQLLVAWNRKFQDILDVPDDIIARRQTFSEYIHYLAERGEYDRWADPAEHVRQVIEQAGQSRTYERTRPDGRVIEIRHNPVPGGGFVLIYADITERKRNEAEIRAARDAAEEASRTIEAAYRDLEAAQANLVQAEKMASLGQLTAGIAHEIKNPLNFVNNFAALSVELLDELKETAAPGFAALTDKQRAEVEEVSAMLTSNLEKITEHGKRADGIVKAMLEHSRGSSGERRVVDLNALIDEALNLAYHGARAQDQSFNITLERDIGAGITPIEVNPQDITRVFLNIFSNGFYAATRRARESRDAGFAPTLKVSTRDAGAAVEIRVRDNGTGIPADIRDKLFQPFFTTKPTGEGTGLGLSITYDIVTQQHGGNIAVESEVGDYSEFTIRLPRNT